jgi:hypothetical protein
MFRSDPTLKLFPARMNPEKLRIPLLERILASESGAA